MLRENADFARAHEVIRLLEFEEERQRRALTGEVRFGDLALRDRDWRTDHHLAERLADVEQ